MAQQALDRVRAACTGCPRPSVLVDARGHGPTRGFGCKASTGSRGAAGRSAAGEPRRGCAPLAAVSRRPVAAATGVPGLTVEAVEGLSPARSSRNARSACCGNLTSSIKRRRPFAGCQVRYRVSARRGARRGRVFGAKFICGRARRGWRGALGSAKPICTGCWPEPVPDPLRRAMPQPGQVLGRVLHRLPADFEVRYRYRPWLVETSALRTTRASFKAANFVWVGHTRARAPDRAHTRAGTVKSVYMYELEPRCAGSWGWRGSQRRRRWRPATPRRCPVDGERVWRGAVGRQAFVGASARAGALARCP